VRDVNCWQSSKVTGGKKIPILIPKIPGLFPTGGIDLCVWPLATKQTASCAVMFIGPAISKEELCVGGEGRCWTVISLWQRCSKTTASRRMGSMEVDITRCQNDQYHAVAVCILGVIYWLTDTTLYWSRSWSSSIHLLSPQCTFIAYILILPVHLLLLLPSGCFPKSSLVVILYAFLLSPSLATRPVSSESPSCHGPSNDRWPVRIRKFLVMWYYLKLFRSKYCSEKFVFKHL